VILASLYGLPVSTTHVSVGSLFGIGMTRHQVDFGVLEGLELTRCPLVTSVAKRLPMILPGVTAN